MDANGCLRGVRAWNRLAIGALVFGVGCTLSQHWSEKALHSIEQMLENVEDRERRKSLEWRKLTLQERNVEIGIELDHSPASLPGDFRPG